jgi:hypothetical protein
MAQRFMKRRSASASPAISQVPRRRAPGVIVHALDRRAGVDRLHRPLVADADGVVEHPHPDGPNVFDQLRHFAIIDGLALGLVGKVLHRRV